MDESHKKDQVSDTLLLRDAGNGGTQCDLFLKLHEVISSLESCAWSWRSPSGSGSVDGSDTPSGNTTPCGAIMTFPLLAGLTEELQKVFPHDDKWLQSEISRYRQENAALRDKLRVTDREIDNSKLTLMEMMEEKDTLQIQISKLQGYLQEEAVFSLPTSMSSSPDCAELCNPTTETPLAVNDPLFSKAPISTLQNMIQYLQDLSGIQPSLPCTPELQPSNMETEIEWLKGKLDCLKRLNAQLCATLEECKSDSGKLSMQLGKLESTCTAFRLALQSSEKCLKAYSVMLALTEAKGDIILGQMSDGDILNSGWSSLPKDLEIKTKLFMMEVKKTFRQDRTKLEADKGDARSPALPRLMPAFRFRTRNIPYMKNQILLHYLSGSRFYSPWLSEEDEQMLKNYVQHLKQDFASISVMENLQMGKGVHSEIAHLADIIKTKADNAIKVSSETSTSCPERLLRAQIVQDLFDTKEGLAELKASIQLLQTEKRALELQSLSYLEEEKAYMLIRDQLQQELSDWAQKKKDEDSGLEHPGYGRAALGHCEQSVPHTDMQRLLESLARGSEMKVHVEVLSKELDELTCRVHAQKAQSAKIIIDFFKAHRNLFITYQNAQRKYHEQQRRLESQAHMMSQCHIQQLHDLMQNILSLQAQQTARETGETSL
ncbi:colorectal mutant cancer protein isoform X2 [Xenopus laevis]|uniref:Colorectal mutant cancer protein isoform X2 n=1 Tax=Xenopus laevis TaxID=8355 RepID=A0A8J1M2N8_XENLA|nr:colorectal mutant cancer protein isoform X2 [Xenopus laevis]